MPRPGASARAQADGGDNLVKMLKGIGETPKGEVPQAFLKMKAALEDKNKTDDELSIPAGSASRGLQAIARVEHLARVAEPRSIRRGCAIFKK